MAKRRTDSIVAVTVVKFATMFIEADTPKEAYEYARRYCDEVDDRAFEDSNIEVHSYETYATSAYDSWASEIWVEEGRRMTYDEYMDELEAQDEAEELEAIRAQEEQLAEFEKRQQQINFEDYE